MEKFLEMTSKIELDLDKHPGGISDLNYEPSFIIRGLDRMLLGRISYLLKMRSNQIADIADLSRFISDT